MPEASRLIFVEGVPGAGKSTTAKFIARQLTRNGIAARFIFEGGGGVARPHPTRLMPELPRPFKPWLDLTPAAYVARTREKWRTFVAEIRRTDTVVVFDGQLFHGNLTDLLLMDSTRAELEAYVRDTLAITAEFDPILIYFQPPDLDAAIRQVCAERGRAWEQYQTSWKLTSPYAERRRLSGLAGLIELYRDYRALTDDLVAGPVAERGIKTLRIDDAAGGWPGRRRQILAFLGLPPVDDSDTSWWPEPVLPPPTIWGSGAGREPSATGQAVPGLEAYDEAMLGLLTRWQVPGAALAVAREGRLILARGYGLAHVEREQPVQPDSLFRIAGVSKPITAVAILKLVEQGRLDLDGPAISWLGHLLPPAGAPADERLWRITVRHLLQHAGGWDSAQGFDPMFHPPALAEARALSNHGEITAEAIVRVVLGRPLNFEPGTRYAYSNVGYCVLGRVIERVTGQPYETFVQTELLRSLGVSRMQVGQTMVEGLAEGEVHYYDPGAAVVAPTLGPGGRPFGVMDAHGGWIGSTIDLVRFLSALDGLGAPAPLAPATVALMRARPGPPLWVDTDEYYGLGWTVRPLTGVTAWWHHGSLPRTIALLVGNSRGIARAVLVNTRPDDWRIFQGEVEQALSQVGRAVTAWPSHDLFGAYLA